VISETLESTGEHKRPYPDAFFELGDPGFARDKEIYPPAIANGLLQFL
jgi:hypothetical protein